MNAIAGCLSFWNSGAYGLEPKVHVVGRNYDNTLTLTTGSGKVSLGVSAAERVWVKTANGKSSHKPEGR